jgi:hypothetical protein
MHNPLNLGQSHAGTFESLLRVKTLHYAKQLVQVLHIKSYSIVFDKYERIEQLIRRLGYGRFGTKGPGGVTLRAVGSRQSALSG